MTGEPVRTETCKLITDATYAKIEAEKQLLEAKIQGIKNTIYVSSLVLGIAFSMIQIVLNVYRP